MKALRIKDSCSQTYISNLYFPSQHMECTYNTESHTEDPSFIINTQTKILPHSYFTPYSD